MRGDAGSSADRRRVDASAVRVGLWMSLAAVAVVGIITAIVVGILVAESRPGPPGRGGPGGDGHGPGDRVLLLGDAVPLAIVLGVCGVVALGILAWHLSRRAARPLEEALAVQRAFVADAGHELRTPLTTLGSRIQLAEHRAATGGDVLGALADLRRDAAVMNDTLSDLLLAAEVAGGRAVERDVAVTVADAVHDAVAVIRPRADEAGVVLDAGLDEGLRAGAERAALTRALIALLDNAVRHSPRGGTVTVRAVRAGGAVHVRVADQGGGIADDPETLFGRFVRGTDAAGRGFGLGLALVRDIAARYAGTVVVERTSGAGTVFLLALPVART